MTGFSPGWLDLREPADRAARDAELLDDAVAFAAAVDAPLLVDLGGGTGSTLRAMPGLPETARWRIVDRDPALLAHARDRHPAAETVEADLVRSTPCRSAAPGSSPPRRCSISSRKSGCAASPPGSPPAAAGSTPR
ncbi:hypothetical protein [Methylobrevis pamukkalensis]|uniref:Uncharacterized protein n=1 Tax=Methylobrevis pamukkalensis TaxID=1439726 RepID=A0A1E3H3W4_9HYPH|nr:hypothetical protein [Methylobrevis pamukkalensis]ODN70984.1 hypothetical protein A6302_01685 [Methylobrevis pamukkalensis]